MSAHIRARANRDGTKSYLVVYRRGGRAFPLESAGTFKTRRDARLRRDLIAGWLAIGIDPKGELARLLAPPVKPPTLREKAYAYIASRIDLAPKSVKDQTGHIEQHILPGLGETTDPATITIDRVQQWINSELEQGRAPKSIRAYQGVLAKIFDYCEIEPNPARAKKLSLPTVEEVFTVPPTDKHVLAMLDQLDQRWRKPFVVIEQTGVRVGEPMQWTLADVDWETCRILSRPEYVKGRRGTRRARWVQIPEWLLDLVEDDLPPVDDRHPDMRLFPGFADDALRYAMRVACEKAGIPHYHPHDLRHRRISLWHGQGIPAREIGDRVGQRKVSTTLDQYTHTMPLDEVDQADYEPRLRAER